MRAYRVWQKNEQRQLNFNEFVQLIGGTKHHAIRARLIRGIRMRQQLLLSPAVLFHLENLVLLAEKLVGMGPERRRENFPQLLTLIKATDPDVAELISNENGQAWKFVARWSEEDLDELCRLIEHSKELQMSVAPASEN